jgi:type IV secretory pathway TrbL component
MKVSGEGNVSESVHEDKEWYRISVEHVIFFLIILQFFIAIMSTILGQLMIFILVVFGELCLYCNFIVMVFIVCDSYCCIYFVYCCVVLCAVLCSSGADYFLL